MLICEKFFFKKKHPSIHPLYVFFFFFFLGFIPTTLPPLPQAMRLALELDEPSVELLKCNFMPAFEHVHCRYCSLATTRRPMSPIQEALLGSRVAVGKRDVAVRSEMQPTDLVILSASR